MNRFAELLDRLTYEPARNAKLRLMTDYFRSTPDPERGWALAALTGALNFPHAKAGLIRSLIAERTDPVLFELSYDYVGDLSETVALMWPTPNVSSPACGGGGERSEPVGVGPAAFEQAGPLHHASHGPPPPLRGGGKAPSRTFAQTYPRRYQFWLMRNV
jgi:DNA ligase 1